MFLDGDGFGEALVFFKKHGEEVHAAVQRSLDRTRTELQDTSGQFERQKEKSALARIRELETQIERLERILRNLDRNASYDLTEQDLEDWGL